MTFHILAIKGTRNFTNSILKKELFFFLNCWSTIRVFAYTKSFVLGFVTPALGTLLYRCWQNSGYVAICPWSDLNCVKHMFSIYFLGTAKLLIYTDQESSLYISHVFQVYDLPLDPFKLHFIQNAFMTSAHSTIISWHLSFAMLLFNRKHNISTVLVTKLALWETQMRLSSFSFCAYLWIIQGHAIQNIIS